MFRNQYSCCYLLIAALGLSSCFKPDKFPIEPSIELESYTVILDTVTPLLQNKSHLVIINFQFKDGDGDIGLENSDTLPPYNKSSKYRSNLFVHYIGIKNGASQEPVLYDYRIPTLVNSGKNKAIEGKISVKQLFIELDGNGKAPYDTVYYEIQIVDRKLHESNIILTPQIVFN